MTDDPASHIDVLCAAHELTDQPDAAFRALDAALSASVGHILSRFRSPAFARCHQAQ